MIFSAPAPEQVRVFDHLRIEAWRWLGDDDGNRTEWKAKKEKKNGIVPPIPSFKGHVFDFPGGCRSSVMYDLLAVNFCLLGIQLSLKSCHQNQPLTCNICQMFRWSSEAEAHNLFSIITRCHSSMKYVFSDQLERSIYINKGTSIDPHSSKWG